MSAHAPLRRVSTVEALVEALRERLLGGDLAPGAPLREVELAAAYGVGRHSVRAALQVLDHEGLVRREPHRGAFVPELGPADVEDLFVARAALELEAARRAARRGAAPAGARAAVEQLEALAGGRERAPWSAVVEADFSFHEALVEAAGSTRLARAWRALEGEIRLSLAHQRRGYDDPAEVAAEHRELLAALERGDERELERALRAHLARAVEMLTRGGTV